MITSSSLSTETPFPEADASAAAGAERGGEGWLQLRTMAAADSNVAGFINFWRRSLNV